MSESESWYPLPREFRAHAAACPHSVLLETAKEDGDHNRSLLFVEPLEQLIAWTPTELDGLLAKIDSRVDEGYFIAGYFDYECGKAFVGFNANSRSNKRPDEPLAWLGVFAQPIVFDHRTGVATFELPSVSSPTGVSQRQVAIQSNGLQISVDEYLRKIDRIHSYLIEGDTYQVNFTDRITGTVEAEPLNIYEELIGRQPTSFAAFLNLPENEILSFSPELFFRTSDRNISVRPMKGTWPRGRDIYEDIEAEKQLLSDPKNRSEHIIIVDLLRNDLGQVCDWGSVTVDRLFQAERYSTLFQMTSNISGRLREKVRATQVFRALFPSGSITGAPKRRTMEIIRELEDKPRGVYTGAIGYFGPNGDACFNVAIRTLVFKDKSFSMGVGGGITVGSNARDEYEECRLKGAFLTRKREPISLIETMRAVDGEIPLQQRHLQRLSASAKYFDISYDQLVLQHALTSTPQESRGEKIRLELNEAGEFIIESSPLDELHWKGRLLLSSQRTSSADVLLRHKTTNRSLYNEQKAVAKAQDFDEIIFLNEEGSLTEGAITNIFLRCGDQWLTPSLGCGVLPGVQRGVLLETLPNAQEKICTLDILKHADEIIVCNALRCILPVASVHDAELSQVWSSGKDDTTSKANH